MYDKDIINKVKENIDIIDIIKESVPTLKAVGKDYKALSPFTNEKTPSFYVSREKQFFKDFSSGKGGDVIVFIREFHNMTFNEAVEFLASKAGIELSSVEKVKTNFDKLDKIRKALSITSDYFHNNLFKIIGEPYQYLFNRGITNDSIKEFQLGYASDSWNQLHNYLKKYDFEDELLIEIGLLKNNNGKVYDAYRDRLIFPIRDELGRVVGFGGRTYKKDDKTAKYINSPQSIIYDKSKLLYGLFESKREISNKKNAILVEGYLDVISLHQEGIKNVVASSGTALSEHQIKIISRHSNNLYIIYDSDKAGVSAANRVMDIALQNNLEIKLVQLPDGEDPDSIIHHYGRNTFNNYLSESIDFVQFRINTTEIKDNPSSEAELLRGLINSIKQIPDRLKHDYYLRRIADILKLTDFQFANLYNEKKKIENQDRKNEAQKLQQDTKQVSQQLVPSKEEPIESFESFNKRLSQLLPAEVEILRYLIEKYDEFYELTEDYEIGEDTFISQNAKDIYQILLEAEGHNLIEYLSNNEKVTNSIKNMIIGLPFSKEQLNEKLAKDKNISTEFTKETIIQALISLQIEKMHSIENKKFENDDISDDILFEIENITKTIHELEFKRSEITVDRH
jgi:DNA primase